MTVHLIKHTYPEIIGLAISNILASLSCVTVTQYIISGKLSWNAWKPIQFSRLPTTFAYTSGSLIGSLIGALIGSLTFYLHMNISLPNLFFRWFSVVELMLITVVPLMISLLSVDWSWLKFWRKEWKYSNVFCLVMLPFLPIPIWVTTALIPFSFGTVAGLYVDFPIVIGTYFYGGTFIGSLSCFVVAVSSMYCLSSYHGNLPENIPLEQRVAATTLFNIFMTITSMIISAILHERNTALQNVEQQVCERTIQLQETMEVLSKAQVHAEQLSDGKSQFLVRDLFF